MKGNKKVLIGIIAVVVLALIGALAFVLVRCGAPEPPVPTDPTAAPTEPATEPAGPTEPENPALSLPCKIWDMEMLPKSLIDEGMAYSNSSSYVYGNANIGGYAGKGLLGSQAFGYEFIGNQSDGDSFIMSPKSLKDAAPKSNWTNAGMLWFWVSGSDLLQNVRLDIIINGKYLLKDTPYYSLDENGQIVDMGMVPIGWGETTGRGRIRLDAGWEGWLGVPLSTFDYPEIITSLQIIVGNSTIKAGNILYLDDFWLTNAYEAPPLSKEELSYSNLDSLTLGKIWDVNETALGEAPVGIGTTAGRNNATATIVAGKGVLESNALSYNITSDGNTNSQNMDVMVNGLKGKGGTMRGIKDPSNILWFWVDSHLSAYQLMHVQLNGVFMDDQKSIYTIKSNNGTPELQEVRFRSNKGTVSGVSVVPYDGQTSGKYARIEISEGWSGWIGIPVGNFCVNSDGTPAEIPNGMTARITFRLFGDKTGLKKGNKLYFDEFWITEAGQMPDLSDEALTYGYTRSYVRPTVHYGRIWNAEGVSDGRSVGTVERDTSRNTISASVKAGYGVLDSKALTYKLTSIGKTNSDNLALICSELESIDFKAAIPTKSNDLLWFWVDSAVDHDVLLHIQINNILMDKTSIYTIVDKDGKPAIKEVPYSNNGALVGTGIGVVPSGGKTDENWAYSRIKICDGWSGWIGIPVDNFCRTSDGKKAAQSIVRLEKYLIRAYVTNSGVLAKGDLFYFDEFWMTKFGEMPDLTDEELLFGYTPVVDVEYMTYGKIWDAEAPAIGTAIGGVGAQADRNLISVTVKGNMGILGSKAMVYTNTSSGKTNGNNVDIAPAEEANNGFKVAKVTKGDDILWFWADSNMSSDQLLHIQVGGMFMTLGKSIYTIEDVDGVPTITEVKYTPDGTTVTEGIGLVPVDGKVEQESHYYNRIKLCKGWSGWIGIPVDNFRSNSNGTLATKALSLIDKLQIRNYLLSGSQAHLGDAIAFDEFWLTKAGEMPDLSTEALLYKAAEVVVPDAPTTHQTSLENFNNAAVGGDVGSIGSNSGYSQATASVTTNGIGGSNAATYKVDSFTATNSENFFMTFASTPVNATDVLWFWVDSDYPDDRLLHVQLQGSHLACNYIYTIENVDGVATRVRVEYSDGTTNGTGLALVNSSGKGGDGSYARIRLDNGWFGWIGIPVENFCGNGSAVPEGPITNMQIRLFGSIAATLVNKTVHFDELWLTDKDAMPNLTNEELFFNGDADEEAQPDLMFNSRYGSGMIFQQNKPFTVHGNALPEKTVTVTLAKGETVLQTKECATGTLGGWTVSFDGVAGSYDIYTITVTDGTDTVKLEDVVFGEVWVVGGQSNMAYDYASITTAEQKTAFQAALAANSNASYIRFFTHSGSNSTVVITEPSGTWGMASKWEDVQVTSATGIYFAEQLQKKLNIPVGFVVSAEGGTGITAWVDPAVAANHTEYMNLVLAKGYDKTSAGENDYLAGWFNSRAATFAGYEVSGILWYQGEHERGGNWALQTLGLPVLVESWSKNFNSEETVEQLPFVAIQIAPYGGVGNDDALTNNFNLNAAMREGVAEVAKTGKAVCVSQYDLYVTVNDIHPKNKPELSARCANVAYALVYTAEDDAVVGPTVKDVTFADGKITITFENVGTGLKYIRLNETDNFRVLESGHAVDTSDFFVDKLNGFSVKMDNQLVSVDAVIKGTDTVEITIPTGKIMETVYYAYGHEVLSANLFGSAGLPAEAFAVRNPDFVAGTQQVSLQNFDSMTVGDTVGVEASNGGNINSTVAANGGIDGSNAMNYSIVDVNNNNSNNVELVGLLSSHTVRETSDILWFWVDSDLSAERLLHVQGPSLLYANNLTGATIYTIVNDNGTAKIQSHTYAGANTSISTFGLVNSNWGVTTGTYGRIKIPAGWSGWVGIPAGALGYSADAAIGKLVVRLYGDRNYAPLPANESFYIDELWLTSADTMPNLTNEQLLYIGDEVSTTVYNVTFNGTNVTSNGAATATEGATYTATLTAAEGYKLPETVTVTVGGAAAEHTYNATTGALSIANVTGDVVITAAGVEDEQPEPEDPADKQISLQNFDSLTAGTAFGTISGTNAPATSTVEANAGIADSNAINYSLSFTKTNSKNVAFTTFATHAAFESTDIVWFWVNSDLTEDRLLHVQLNGSHLAKKYIYTIANVEGVPTIQTVNYSAEAREGTGLALVDSNGNGNADATSGYARIRLDTGWFGWIGIPVENFSGNGSAVPTGTVTNLTLRTFGTQDAARANESVYFDEIWLTSAGKMPNLTNEELLYNPDPVVPTTYTVTFDGTNVISNGAATVTEGESYTATLAATAGYALPETITVTVGGAAAEYTYDAATGALSISNVTGDVVITAAGVAIPNVYTVTFNGTNVTSNGAATVNEGESYTATLTPAEGYTLPESVTVTVGGAAAEHTYDAATGALSISNVTGDVVITAAGVEEEQPEPEEPADKQVPLQNFNALNAGDNVGTLAGTTSHAPVSSTVVAAGISGSNAADYNISYSKTNSRNVTFSEFAAHEAVAGTDIVWFWVDSDLTEDRLLHVQLNNAHLAPNYVYTIENVSGVPTIQQVDYTDATREGDGLALVNSSGNGGVGTYARICLDTGWFGWIGIPVENFNGSTNTTPGTAPIGQTITSVTFRTFGTQDTTKANESVYFDEIWLTSAGKLPNLTNEELFYNGDPTTPDPEPEEPTVYNVTFNGTNVTSNGAATVTEGETYTATLTPAEGYTLPESVTVTVGGAAAEHTYDAATGELSLANVTGDVVITAAGVYIPKTFTVTFNGTNVTSNGAATVTEGEGYTATLTAAEGYALPTNITVTVGGSTVTFGYNTETGALSVPNVSGDLVITAEGVQIVATYQISLQNFDSLTADTAFGTISGTNAPATSTVKAEVGIAGSNGIEYSLSFTKTNSKNVAFTTFATHEAFETTDIVWFWVDSDLTEDRLLHVQLNNSHLAKKYIYTIANVDGVPTIQTVNYSAETREGTGLALVDSNGNGNADATSGYARIRLDTGWFGWIGIPVENFSGNGSAVPTGTVTNLTLRTFGTQDAARANEIVYFDEIWLTSANTMPNLTAEELFHDGDYVAPVIVTSAPLVSFADGATVADLSQTTYAVPNTTANSTLSVTDGKGVNGKSAITVAINEDAGDNAVGDWWFVRLKNLPSTVATVNTDAFTSILPGTTAADLMIWFYMDGTALTEDARLNFGLSTNDGDTLGTATYRYTQEKQYYIDAFGKVQSIYLGSNATSNGFVSTNDRGRVTIEAGVGNWIGIPVNRFGSGDVTSLHNIRFSLVRGADRDSTGTQPILHAGDSLSIGDIWLTTKDEEGNWVIPEPAAKGLLSEEYYTADDYLADATLFTPVWGSTYSVPAEMLDWNEKFNSFYDPDGRLMSVAHRGDRNIYYPENSLEGFMSVIAAGVDIIEVDVIKTKDGIPVAIHGGGTAGNDLTASTNINELRKAGKAYHLPSSDVVTDWTLEELRQLRLVKGSTVTSYVIPTLEDVIKVAKNRVFINLDKWIRYDWDADILPLIQKTGAYETVLLSQSYNENRGYQYTKDRIDQLVSLGARKAGVMSEAWSTSVDTVVSNINTYGLPKVLRLHEFKNYTTQYGGNEYELAKAYVGDYRIYLETLTSAQDNKTTWAEIVEYGGNIIMSNRYPYELAQYVKELHFTPKVEESEFKQISLQNFNALTAGIAYGTQQTTNAAIDNKIAASTGVGGSNALAYIVKAVNNNQNKNIAFGTDFAAHTIDADTDVLWFWVDSDLSAERMLHVQINGTTQAIGSIFTIDNDNGTPKIREVAYVADRAQVTGVAPVNSNLDLTGTYARNKLPVGWSGWIGIPVSAYGLSSGSITSVQIRIYGDKTNEPLKVDDVLYLDEFWLTEAGKMPNLSNAQLLYTGD